MKIKLILKILFFCISTFCLIPSPFTFADEGDSQLIQIQQYKPMYFLMGQSYTKIQVSFKAQVVRALPIYVGYTQLMMWNLFIKSPYFYDINYSPNIFYRLMINSDKSTWLDLGPYEHESNGKGGLEERSWDRIFARYHSVIPIDERMKLFWSLKAWAPIHYNPANTDLARYRGVWELEFSLADFLGYFFERGDLTLRLYPGGKYFTNPFLGGQELTFRCKSAHRDFLPFFVAQLFHGYAENLFGYQDERFAIRAGIGF